MKKLALIALCLSTSACASIIKGTHQDVTVNTLPDGAACDLQRQNQVIAHVNQSPATVKVDKTKYDLDVLCTKPGYQPTTVHDKSGIEPWTFGNILIGGLIGWGIDSAVGADNKYDSPVFVTLRPQGEVLVPAVVAPAPMAAAPVMVAPAAAPAVVMVPVTAAPVAAAPAPMAATPAPASSNSMLDFLSAAGKK